jgi:hypothetical protein
MKKILTLLFFILSISCGFRSIYNESPKYNANNTIITIKHNPNHDTQVVETKYLNLFLKELNISKDKNKESKNFKYKIEIYLNWYKAGSLRQSSGNFSRTDIILKVNYEIRDSNNKILYKDNIKTIDSMDISTTRFTNYTLENFVMDNLIASSVNDLKNEIMNLTLNE